MWALPLLLLAARAQPDPPPRAALLSPSSRANITAAAGIYRSPRRRAAAAGAPSSAVLLVSANSGYAALLRAWMCRARELGLKFVVHAQDAKLRDLLEAKGGGAAAAGYRALCE